MEVGIDQLKALPQKVSCPHCDKQYLIYLKDLHEEANRFICKKCEKDFWLMRSEFEMLFEEPVSVEEPPIVGTPTTQAVGVHKDKCPKCGTEVESLDKECSSCRVVPSKYMALKEESPYLKVSPSLKQLWKRVLNHYDDEPVHHEFLSQCLKENQLRYASLQYKQLREAVGSDEIINEMMAKIQNLSSMDMTNRSLKNKKAEYPAYVKYLRWEFALFAIGAALVMSGLASPAARNLIGLGVVFFALPFLIQVFFLKKQ